MDYDKKPDGYYNNIRYEMLKYLPDKVEKIIEVGCGDGGFAKVVKDKTDAEVWGVEYVAEEAARAGKVIDRAFAGPIEENLHRLPDSNFEVAYFNDVLEHLADPYKLLLNFRKKMAPVSYTHLTLPTIYSV